MSHLNLYGIYDFIVLILDILFTVSDIEDPRPTPS